MKGQTGKADGLNKTQLNKKRESSDLIYKKFDLKKLYITIEELNDLPHGTKYEHPQKLLKKINELRNAKSRTVGTKKEKILLRFVLDTILVIYFLGIMIVAIYLCHQKVMKKNHPCH